MNTHADKTEKNKSQTVITETSQLQSGGKSTFQFINNRSDAVAQRKLQEMANNSPQVSQLRAFQEMANNSPQAKQLAQLQKMANNHSAQHEQPIQKKESIEDKRARIKKAQEGTDLGGADAEPLIVEPSGEVLDAESAAKKQKLEDKRKRIKRAQEGTDLGGADAEPLIVEPSGEVLDSESAAKKQKLEDKRKRIKRAQEGTDLGGGETKPIISNPNGELYLNDPERASQKSDDVDLDYGRGNKESSLNKKSILRKAEVMYSEKNKNNRVTDIPANSLIEYLESYTKLFGPNWVKIKYKEKEGWISTKKNAIDRDKVVKHESAGAIMPNGVPTVEDVKQGMFGSCFLLSALMSLAQNDPDYIKSRLFQTDPTKDAENHSVRFFDVKAGYKPVIVTVKNTVFQLATNLGPDKPSGKHIGSQGAQNWPAIIEKAWNVSPIISNSNGLFGGHGYMASAILTGQKYKKLDFGSGTSMEKRALTSSGKAADDEEAATIILKKNREHAKYSIIESFENPRQKKNIKTAGTHQKPSDDWVAKSRQGDGVAGTNEAKVGGICFPHEYSITKATDAEISLRNPHGYYSRVKGKVMDEAAVSILPWDEFFETFSSASVGS
jgi:hypothetical protein